MERIWEEVLCEENGYQLIVERKEFSQTEDDIIEVEVVEKTLENEKLAIDNEKLIDILKRFVREYIKNKNQDLTQWLIDRLKEEFPEKTQEQLLKESQELIAGVKLGKEKYELVKEKRALGISPSDVLAKDISKTAEGVSIKEVKEELKSRSEAIEKENISSMYKMTKGIEIAPNIMAFDKMTRYFDNINEVIAKGNQKMVDSLITKAGNINQNPQLDGFIFEQFHENTFNIDAAIKDISGIRAEALVPKPGTGYGKNSIDLVVKVKRGETEYIVRKYQAKLSDNPEKLFKDGNYKFQRRLYGEGHEEIGNTKVEYEGIESDALSKSGAKVIQKEVQEGNLDAAKQTFENNVDVKSLSKQIAKQALTSATIGLGMGMALSTGIKLAKGEEIKAEEVIIDGLKAGGSVGLSTAIAGGLKTAVEKKVITGWSANILKNNSVVGTIAFSALSLIGVASSIGSGDLSLKDGMKETGAILAGTYGGIKGSLVGIALAGGVIASVGTILAPVVAAVAGTIGYFAGSTIASNIAKGAAEVASTVTSGVKEVVKAGYNVVKNVASAAWNGVKSVASAVGSAVSSFCSGVASFFGL
ncbi:MAG: hypothetical protein ACRDAG_05280 [Cetobacterium somerae]|uniref:hypothetical protein n=1 Tax=Cetobacterium somerae TaxID=188913 RepID=UPI003F2CEFD1